MALIRQFIRFVGIGFLNTAVDYVVFNLGAVLSGVYTGRGVGYISAASFTVAVFHSYFWNKHWAFAKQEQRRDGGIFKNMSQFISAAVFGAAIIAAVIFGAAQKYSYLFYILMLVILLSGEMALWKIFNLGKNPIASEKNGKEFLLFIIVSLIGILINSQILDKGTTHIAPQFGLNQELWTNLIKIGATGIALIWNFIGYKLVVFKR